MPPILTCIHAPDVCFRFVEKQEGAGCLYTTISHQQCFIFVECTLLFKGILFYLYSLFSGVVGYAVEIYIMYVIYMRKWKTWIIYIKEYKVQSLP
jgi:hypothetical protein